MGWSVESSFHIEEKLEEEEEKDEEDDGVEELEEVDEIVRFGSALVRI